MVCYGKQFRKIKHYVLEDRLVRFCLSLDFRSVNAGDSGDHDYQDVM
jgi:hypothetical protein